MNNPEIVRLVEVRPWEKVVPKRSAMLRLFVEMKKRLERSEAQREELLDDLYQLQRALKAR